MVAFAETYPGLTAYTTPLTEKYDGEDLKSPSNIDFALEKLRLTNPYVQLSVPTFDLIPDPDRDSVYNNSRIIQIPNGRWIMGIRSEGVNTPWNAQTILVESEDRMHWFQSEAVKPHSGEDWRIGYINTPEGVKIFSSLVNVIWGKNAQTGRMEAHNYYQEFYLGESFDSLEFIGRGPDLQKNTIATENVPSHLPGILLPRPYSYNGLGRPAICPWDCTTSIDPQTITQAELLPWDVNKNEWIGNNFSRYKEINGIPTLYIFGHVARWEGPYLAYYPCLSKFYQDTDISGFVLDQWEILVDPHILSQLNGHLPTKETKHETVVYTGDARIEPEHPDILELTCGAKDRHVVKFTRDSTPLTREALLAA